MTWAAVLSSLSPIVAIALIYGWSQRERHKAEESEEQARIRLIEVLASQFVQPITKGLDANTQAVQKSVEHNERIITNHLSHTEALWKDIKEELHRR